MGTEDPWFLLLGATFALLILAAVVFIPIKIVLLVVREWRKRSGD
jgi:hypothetical protein